MIFSEIPSVNEKVFILKSNGGYYEGIKGYTQLFEGSALNNCTAGAWGLMALYLKDNNCKIGCGSRKTNTPTDAGMWWDNSPGFTKSDFPVEGAVGVFSNHVVFVNEIKANGDLVCIESGYGSRSKKGLWTRTLKKDEGYEIGGIYGNLIGFLIPQVEDKKVESSTNEITTDEALTKMAQDVLKGLYGNGTRRKENLYKAIQTKVNQLLK